jgi:hypothetical protein
MSVPEQAGSPKAQERAGAKDAMLAKRTCPALHACYFSAGTTCTLAWYVPPEEASPSSHGKTKRFSVAEGKGK